MTFKRNYIKFDEHHYANYLNATVFKIFRKSSIHKARKRK